MKPPDLDYECPESVAEAVEQLTRPGRQCVPLAGGQSLVRLLNCRRIRPDAVLDLNKIPELAWTETGPEYLRIGAMTRLRELERRSTLPVLAQAAALVGYPQIRSRSTIGGCMCHADPAAELPVVAVATGARLHLRSADGARTLESGEFFRSPFATECAPDELLTAIDFPRHRNFIFRYERISQRPGGPALAGVCAGIEHSAGAVTAARLAVAGPYGRPTRLTAAEQWLAGRPLDAGLDRLMAGSLAGLLPLAADAPDDLDYRLALISVAIRRAMLHITDAIKAENNNGKNL